MSDVGYWELSVGVPADAAEGLSNFVWELGALGVVEEEIPGASPRLRAFFPGILTPEALASRVRDYVAALRDLGFAVPDEPSVIGRADENWEAAWQRHFRPTPVGRRLLVTPPWEHPDPDGRVVIVLEPGRAFGTGQHGSTAGCLERLEAAVERTCPAHGLDLGTGSGILAIAAVRLGVSSMLAIDDDADAVAAAVANAARNQVAERVRTRLGDAHTVEVVPAPLVLANLLTSAHLALAARYAILVAPAGTLILGGILDGEATTVGDAVRAQGFRLHDRVSIDGWTTLELVASG
jgi:ribosomal protein L11 methyltransferase